MPGYLGNDPAGSATKIARQTYTTSGAATTDFTFTSGYDVGYLDVYVNGERQTKGKNFTASDGSTFKVLNGGVGTGSTVEAIAYKTFNLATVDFDDLGNTGNLTLSGDISAVNAVFSGDVSIGGTLTYEDVTSIDSVGVITARLGVDIITGGIDIVGNTTGLNVSGVGTFTGDVSIADKIIHTGDTDTAIRFPAADVVAIESGGNEAFRVHSNGLIGIGNPSPSGLLHLKTSDTTLPIYFSNGDGSQNAAIKHITTSGSERFAISVGGFNVDKLTILNNGNVGIGSTQPTFELDVANTTADCVIALNSPNTSNTEILFGDPESAYSGRVRYGHSTNHLQFNTNSSERLRITSDGDVGIGTEVPETPRGNKGLEVAGTTGAEIVATRTDDNLADGDLIGAFLFKNLDLGGTPNHFAGMYAKANGTAGQMDLHFSSGRSEYEGDRSDLTIRGGLVGIGTNLPLDPLHVLGPDGSSGNPSLSSNNIALFQNDGSTSDGAIISVVAGNAATSQISLGDVENANIGAIKYDNSNNSMKFATNSSDKLTINSGGDVNITGVTTATQLFEGTTRVATSGKAIAMALIFG